jgi:hypothetical protein
MVPIPSKLKNKCEKCARKLIYVRKYRMAFTIPVLTKLAFTYVIFWTLAVEDFIKIVRKCGK